MPKTTIRMNIPVAITANVFPIINKISKALSREGHKKYALEFEERVCGITDLDTVMKVAKDYLQVKLGSGGYI